jgi:hypothetical protein
MKALLKIVARAADAAIDQATDAPQESKKSMGDRLKDAAGNPYVQAGAAAVAVAGVAYGTYKGVQAFRGRKATKAAPAAAAPEMTADEQIAEARRLVTSAEAKLTGKAAKAAVAA